MPEKSLVAQNFSLRTALIIYLSAGLLITVFGFSGLLGSGTASLLHCLALAFIGSMLAGPRYAGIVCAAVALICVPALHFITREVAPGDTQPLLSIEVISQLGRFLCLAIVAIGIDLIWGYTGVLSLCQAMFFVLGGYCMGMYLAMHGPVDIDPITRDAIPRCLYVVSSEVSGLALPWFWKPFSSFPAALILGLLVPGTIAYVFGYFAFRSRVKGVYFSIITQATTLAAWYILCRNSMRLCGTNGLTNFTQIVGYELRKPEVKLALYIVSVLALVGTYYAARHIVNSRLGRVLIAIRDNESRLRFSGYQPLNFKVFVFTLSAAIAGLGGMLYVPQMGIITPANMGNMGVSESIMMVIWVAVGGRGTLTGAILGALIVNYMYNILTTTAPSSWPFVQGGLFIIVVLYFPDGIVGTWNNWMAARNQVPHNDEMPAPIADAQPVAIAEKAQA